VTRLWKALREKAGRLHPGYAAALPLVLVATVAVNLAISPAARHRQPIRIHPGGDLHTIVKTDMWSVDIRYRFYLDLHSVADGAVLVLPPGTFIDPRTAGGLSGVTVEVVDYDPAVGQDIAGLDRQITGSVLVDGRGFRYALVAGPPSDRYWYAEAGREALIVPDRVAPLPDGAADG